MVRFVSFIVLLFASVVATSQPTLPDITGSSDKGINVISWNCQYDGIKSIAVQRSSDSVYNFVTLGLVRNLKKGPQAYIDGHPKPGKNWYRLYIVFNSDLTWYSNRFKIMVDSADILNARVLAPNDSLQKLVANIKIEPVKTEVEVTTSEVTQVDVPPPPPPKITLDIPEEATEDGLSYIKSQYVFTNPFTGHVNVEIPEYRSHHYAIYFYNNEDKKVLEINRVTDAMIIIDKRNFQRKGIYKFELREDRKELETGFVTIY
ncbi:hypothetical protein CAP35_08015 [Chitinophagaceae bacterium IBVUCB1]|nr:hypothetical protein CAP35_08015 [Chitinophagaceae bacterium IBVUCB1]